jgi:hypothetical protein
VIAELVRGFGAQLTVEELIEVLAALGHGLGPRPWRLTSSRRSILRVRVSRVPTVNRLIFRRAAISS